MSNEIVILLHGIGHSMWNMVFVEKHLKKNGYKTLNITYPSCEHEIDDLTKWLHNKLIAEQVWNNYDRVHFTAHSMGGLVSGFYLENFKEKIPQDKLGRVVMLGTPHGGSEVADGLCHIPLYKKVFGPAGQQLTTCARQNNRINPYYDLGIIAGTQNWLYPLGQIFIKYPNDGCVSVESTKLPGMKDHMTLSILHGFMGWSSKIHHQITYFLENGEFNHGA